VLSKHKKTAGLPAVGGAAALAALSGAAALLAGGEAGPRAMERAAISSDAFPPGAGRTLDSWGLHAASSRRIAKDTYLIEGERDGEELLCLMSTQDAGPAGGCNPKRSFFAGRDIVWGMSEQGHPSNPAALSIHGVTRPQIRSVEVRFGAVVIEAPVTKNDGFFIEATPEALDQGRPSQIQGKDATGRVVASVPLPEG
jgi:hypothetical protein